MSRRTSNPGYHALNQVRSRHWRGIRKQKFILGEDSEGNKERNSGVIPRTFGSDYANDYGNLTNVGFPKIEAESLFSYAVDGRSIPWPSRKQVYIVHPDERVLESTTRTMKNSWLTGPSLNPVMQSLQFALSSEHLRLRNFNYQPSFTWNELRDDLEGNSFVISKSSFDNAPFNSGHTFLEDAVVDIGSVFTVIKGNPNNLTRIRS